MNAIDFLAEARRLRPRLSQIRRELHKYPELSWQEVRTTHLIEAELVKLGAEIVPWGSATGAVALLRGAHPGRTVALRADIDALPVEEASDAPYRSGIRGIMHACGHDAHAACALGAATILAAQAASMRGAVKFIFQPAEEKGGGASLLIERGVLADPEVGAIFALHCQPDLPVGRVGLREGPLMAANDLLDIIVRGQGGHGAMPDRTRDPLIAAAAIIQALQTLVARGLDPQEAAVVSFGRITGGTTRNVIPDAVELEGGIRTLNPAVRAELLPRVKRLAAQVAAAYGATGEVSFPAYFPAVNNPAALVGFCRRSLVGMMAGERLVASRPVMVTEDFSQYQQLVPGVMLWLGTGNRELGLVHPLHSDRFDIDEDALVFGAAVMAKLAWDWLEDGNGR